MRACRRSQPTMLSRSCCRQPASEPSAATSSEGNKEAARLCHPHTVERAWFYECLEILGYWDIFGGQCLLGVEVSFHLCSPDHQNDLRLPQDMVSLSDLLGDDLAKERADGRAGGWSHHRWVVEDKLRYPISFLVDWMEAMPLPWLVLCVNIGGSKAQRLQ